MAAEPDAATVAAESSPSVYEAAVASSARPELDRARDARRMPAAVLFPVLSAKKAKLLPKAIRLTWVLLATLSKNVLEVGA
jgi:predicted methyltransferase